MEVYSLLYRFWDLRKFKDLSLYIDSGTWKYSGLSLSIYTLGLGKILSLLSQYRLWDLEKYRVFSPSFKLWIGFKRLSKILSSLPPTQARRQGSKDMKYDLHCLAWPINTIFRLTSSNP